MGQLVMVGVDQTTLWSLTLGSPKTPQQRGLEIICSTELCDSIMLRLGLRHVSFLHVLGVFSTIFVKLMRVMFRLINLVLAYLINLHST